MHWAAVVGYNKVAWVQVPVHLLDEVEQYLIWKHRPRLNFTFNPNNPTSRFKSEKSIDWYEGVAKYN